MTQKVRVFPGRIIFDHLPKTAGQAIRAWLAKSLGRGCVTPNLIGEHSTLIRQYGGMYSIISGHIHFDFGEGLDPRYQYLTFFRDPVDRVVSWIYFVVYNKDLSQTSELIRLAKLFLDSEGREVDKDLLPAISNLYVKHFCRINGTGLEEDDDEKLALALTTIQQYDVVGVYEGMQQFLADVAALIGLPAPKNIARVNVTSRRPRVDQLSPALRQRLMDLNQLDMRLYEQVAAWQADSSAIRLAAPGPAPVTQPRWQPYEPSRDRVVIPEEVIVAGAVLREGNDIRYGQLMTFDVDFFLSREISNLEMGIHIFDVDRRWIFSINSTMLGQSHRAVPAGSYRVSHHLLANLPTGKYTAGFVFSEVLPEGPVQLAWYDVLCHFQVLNPSEKPFVGSTYLPADLSLSPTWLAKPEAVVTNPAGRLTALNPVLSMSAGARTTIGIEVVNQSTQVWIGDAFRPVRFSYHWLKDNGEFLVEDGLRTPLPEDGIAPGQTLSIDMQVAAPQQPGKHPLILTLVQEMVGWFENMGFEAEWLEVEVLPS